MTGSYNKVMRVLNKDVLMKVIVYPNYTIKTRMNLVLLLFFAYQISLPTRLIGTVEWP